MKRLSTIHCLLRTATAYCLLLLLTAGAGFAQSSSVVVTPITANYTVNPPTVTFEVSWPDDRDDDHRSKVWVFVDYKRIKDNAYAPGWFRAGIPAQASAITGTAGSTVSIEPNNAKGFWLQGTAGAFAFAATVTVPVTVNLTGYAPEFGWCGWATDRPPYPEEKTGYYVLHGTPGFIVNGIPLPEASTAYQDCIYSLTDSTGCPGDVPAMPAITDFTASTTTICKGGSVTLTATAANAASYSFNNGAWNSSSITVVSPASATTYTLSVRSAGGCTVTSSKTITITVNDPPTNLSLTADPEVICKGDATTLTASADNAASYSLDGSTWTASEQLTDYPETTTTYTLYIKSAAGCTASLENAATVTVNDLPVVATSNPAARCGAGEVTLNATASGGTTPAMTYTWIVGGDAQQTTSSGSLSLATVAVGSTTYSVTVTNENGCTSAAKTGTITVHTAVATASVSGNSSNTCPTTTVSLSAAATGATSFTWYQNGSPMQTGTSSGYTVTASGSYTVQGKNANCTGTNSLTKVVTICGCYSVPGCANLYLCQNTSSSDGDSNWSTATAYCSNRGTRLPTVDELYCMWLTRASLAGGYVINGDYWSSTAKGSDYYCMTFYNKFCYEDWYNPSQSHYFRCVQ